MVVAGGSFSQVGTTPLEFVGAWDGISWRPMGEGVDSGVKAVTVFDADGPGPVGPEPIIGGQFVHSGSGTVNCITRFDGVQWRPLGLGLAAGGANATAWSLAPWNGFLVAGGAFTSAGGAPAQGIAKWNGVTWTTFADERGGAPNALASIGGVLYAGGYYLVPGTSNHTGI
jgi:hypothetical protein